MTAGDLNRRLGTLLGWSDIVEFGDGLLGTPPAGECQCRGRALVPDWAGDWRHCGPLMVAHCINQADSLLYVAPLCKTTLLKGLAQYVGSDAATRQAIVIHVIAKLEAHR